jgi:ADP-heptose:LPS heptosyltransferase
MSVLILKLNATGDVVRTTALLNRFREGVTWVTARNNISMLDGVAPGLRCLAWEDREIARDQPYDLVINLEDETEVAAFAATVEQNRVFGARLNGADSLTYSEDSRGWFDLSLISRYGRSKADELKLLNRRTYQELIFEGLGLQFKGDGYVLPAPLATDLSGDVAIAPVAGPVWPMKNWAYYDELKLMLEADGLQVNVLPRRSSLLEHLADVRNHRCLVGGDSLPMHFALGTGTPCVTLFSCTSPWEIHDYGLQTQIVSPLLHKFFYKRGYDPSATTAITIDEVYRSVIARLV